MAPSNQLILPVAIGLFLVTPLFSMWYNPNNYAQGRSRDERARIERNSSSVAQLFGELRSSMSDIVFLKTERYLHGGIAYTPHMELAKTVQEETKDYDEHEAEVGVVGGDHDHDHDGKPDHAPEAHDDHDHDHDGHQDHAAEDHHVEEHSDTQIPSEEKDFRGFIGAFERQVRPWQDASIPHTHTSGTELLPWYRVMTISDPQNVRGYLVGTYWLMNVGKNKEAIDFISEGIRNNPNSFQLPLYKGRAILRDLKYGENAQAKTLDSGELETDDYVNPEIIDNYVQAAELVIKTRPEVYDMRTFDPYWTNYMEDDAGAAIRTAVSSLRRAGRIQEALDLAKRGAPRLSFYDEQGNFYPDDPKLLEYIENLEEMLALGVTE